MRIASLRPLVDDTPEREPDTRPAVPNRLYSSSLAVIAALAIVVMLWWAQALLITIVLGVLMSYALDPLQRRLVSWHFPRALAASLLLVAMLATIAGSLILVRQQALGFIGQLPAVTQRFRVLLHDGGWDGRGAVGQVQQAATELKRAAEESALPADRGITRVQVEEPPVRLSDMLWRGTFGAVAAAGELAILVFLVYYLLVCGDLYKRKIVTLTGDSDVQQHVALEILMQITEQIERFLRARILISVIVGVATGGAFWLLGVAQPAIWGIGAGVLNTIPYLGPTLVSVAAGIAGLMQFGTGTMALVLCGVATGIACIEGFLITPWLMGRAGRMNAGAVFICLSFWGWIWGIWGLLLAVPIMMALKAVGDHVDSWRPVSVLLSD